MVLRRFCLLAVALLCAPLSALASPAVARDVRPPDLVWPLLLDAQTRLELEGALVSLSADQAEPMDLPAVRAFQLRRIARLELRQDLPATAPVQIPV